MEYQSLYRKYRPKNFDQVVGQEIVLKILKNALEKKKISHAYLFAGPRGTGKTSIAKILAKAINCELPKNGNPCGECKFCQISTQKETIDILEIDAASNNGVDEIRELRNKINLVPSSLNYKIYIIDEVHMLSTGAFNALLKTLEEPPLHAIFILATTELNKVPSTILSRCQILEFKKISNSELKRKLKEISTAENITIDEDAIEEIAKHCDGGMRDAIGILEKLSLYATEEIKKEDVKKIMGNISTDQVEELINNIKQANIEEIIRRINEYNDYGIDMITIANELILYLRDEIFENQSKISNELSSIIEKLNIAISKMTISNTPKVILEITLLNICNIDKLENIDISVKENKQTTTESPKKEEKTPEVIKNDENKYKELKTIRINNTFARADKKRIIEIREKWNLLRDEAFDTECGAVARTLYDDAKPVAASDEYLVLTFKMECIANQCNDSLEKLERIIEKVFLNPYKVICLNEQEWYEKIEDYKKNKEKYQYVEEKIEKVIEKAQKEESLMEKAKELFGEI